MGIKFLFWQISLRFGEAFQDFGKFALKIIQIELFQHGKWDVILICEEKLVILTKVGV
jgi:hypothetical protein